MGNRTAKTGDWNDLSKQRYYPASRPDEDNPGWTREDFHRARPALEVIAEVFGAPDAEQIRCGRNRPQKPNKKVNQTLRLELDVL